MGRLLKPFGLLLLMGLAGLAGCRPKVEETTLAPLETEEIAAPVDAAVTTEYDIRAKSSLESVGAKLPSDFPRDLPLYSASSVINYGPAASDRRFVELSIPAQPSAVERRYNAQIEAAGWRRGEVGEFVRQGRRIVVTYREGTPGTWVRIEYPT